jgi:hypothetical protein
MSSDLASLHNAFSERIQELKRMTFLRVDGRPCMGNASEFLHSIHQHGCKCTDTKAYSYQQDISLLEASVKALEVLVAEIKDYIERENETIPKARASSFMQEYLTQERPHLLPHFRSRLSLLHARSSQRTSY